MKIKGGIILITDRRRVSDLVATVSGCLEAGLGCVMLREKDLDAGPLLDLAKRVGDLTKRHGASLIINERVDVALAVGADAVHLGTKSFRPCDILRYLPENMAVGVSAHGLDEAISARDDGADYVTLSPVFETTSKPGAKSMGIDELRKIIGLLDIPAYALGGIGVGELGRVMDAGAAGVAVISSVLGRPDPVESVAELIGFMEGRVS